MVGVAALDIGGRLGDKVAVGVDVVLVNVAAENGGVGLPVALVAAGLRAGKAAVNCHNVLEGEGGGAVGGVSGGVVHAGLDPDLLALTALVSAVCRVQALPQLEQSPLPCALGAA
ncbi:hypothetical protein [Roseiflexus castenholzii]|uniref:hypothetical protein n=1 Tax=Roseiflexus castenholzii TaxID=120962 RepID=UPI00031FF181|nr:hypothetical protein [Roseiflexus castenholzii]